MAARRYSRLANIEDRKNKRKSFFFLISAILVLLLLFWFGLGFTPKLIEFATNLSGKDSTPATITDNVPPAPPRLDTIPEFTTDNQIKVSGNTEAGSTVTIFFNKTQKEVVANSDGDFSTMFNLLKGENTLKAISQDQDGNKSAETKAIIVTHDSEPPEIIVKSPQDKQIFFGQAERKITIEGTTDNNASLTINGRVVVVGGNGSFSMPTTLENGQNTFEIIATDEAGNKANLTLTVELSL